MRFGWMKFWVMAAVAVLVVDTGVRRDRSAKRRAVRSSS